MMYNSHSLGRALVVMGMAITAIGVLFLIFNKTGWLGRLPGDILIQNKGMSIYFPITTSIIISVVISLVLYLVRR